MVNQKLVDSGLRGCGSAAVMLGLRMGLAKVAIRSEVDVSDGVQARLMVPRGCVSRARSELSKLVMGLHTGKQRLVPSCAGMVVFSSAKDARWHDSRVAKLQSSAA